MTVIESILAVFTAVLEWFVESLGSITAIFYSSDSGLTFIGTTSVITVAIAIVCLVIAMLRSLLKLRG